MWFATEGFVAPDSHPEDVSESGVPRAYLKAFPSIVPLLNAWSVYTGIHALCDPTGGGVAAAFSIYTTLLLQFSTQYEWPAVLRYHYEFTRLWMAENFRPTRWINPDVTLVSTCLIRYPLLAVTVPPSNKKRALADCLSSPTPSTVPPTSRTKIDETCYKFNDTAGCRMGDNCARNHVCIGCRGPHAVHACPKK
ncbi:hypothetical protein K438DRAFT_1852433 [Mycena galopus ATCC 62051]|nr:hypothetical protein K438DRAFT_1852433 [Mycena galopus ATCC 62051]